MVCQQKQLRDSFLTSISCLIIAAIFTPKKVYGMEPDCINISCTDFKMIPSSQPVVWTKGAVPLDGPVCGFFNEQCPKLKESTYFMCYSKH